MSEEQDYNPPKPTTKTSAVPLKKETVRITLRPNAPGADAPPATVPLAPPPRPSFGGAPPPPAPTVPLSPPPRPSMAGGPPAPSAPTAPGAPPRPAPPVAPVGSKTIPLGAAPPRAATPGVARPAPASPSAPGGTQPLPPRSAVARTPSASPTAAITSAPIKSAAYDEDAEVDDGPLNILAVVALVASIAAAFLAFASVDSWPMSEGTASSQAQKTAWESSLTGGGFKLPLDYSPFDKKAGDTVTSNFESAAPQIPAAPAAE